MTSQLRHKFRASQAVHGHDDITTLPQPGQVIVMKIWTPQVLTRLIKPDCNAQPYYINFDCSTFSHKILSEPHL